MSDERVTESRTEARGSTTCTKKINSGAIQTLRVEQCLVPSEQPENKDNCAYDQQDRAKAGGCYCSGQREKGKSCDDEDHGDPTRSPLRFCCRLCRLRAIAGSAVGGGVRHFGARWRETVREAWPKVQVQQGSSP
jgi:hypothetical protein